MFLIYTKIVYIFIKIHIIYDLYYNIIIHHLQKKKVFLKFICNYKTIFNFNKTLIKLNLYYIN